VARDLIPPPSPAGRPSADPEQRELAAPSADALAETGAPVGAGRAGDGPAPFRSRFGFVLGALLGILACAGVAFALLLGSSPPAPGGVRLAEHWSPWVPPTSDPAAGAAAIAAHVGPGYRFDDGKQLVAVDGSPLEYGTVPLTVDLRDGDTSRTYGSDGLLYTLRGGGKDGRLAGAPSETRHALLRREALELALYSFRYLDGITEVVTLLPPAFPVATASARAAKGDRGASVKSAGRGKPQVQAIYYRPGDLVPQLGSPLAQTLDGGRQRPRALTPVEKRRIDALTMPNLFLASYQVAQNQLPYLVLDRVNPPR